MNNNQSINTPKQRDIAATKSNSHSLYDFQPRPPNSYLGHHRCPLSLQSVFIHSKTNSIGDLNTQLSSQSPIVCFNSRTGSTLAHSLLLIAPLFPSSPLFLLQSKLPLFFTPPPLYFYTITFPNPLKPHRPHPSSFVPLLS